MFSAKELIKSRRSVRTFDGRALSVEDRRHLTDFISSVSNPFGVPVTFGILDAKQYGLSSPVIVGATEYLAAKVERLPNFEAACGYSFEKVCLYALSLGIGTVMLAASLNRASFEKAINVGENEVMPVASPVGYPADKMSMRETLMRKGIKADSRKSFDNLFFMGSFNKPLAKENAGIFAEALEAVRLAPSAANGQPWRAVVDGDLVHFFEAKSMKDSSLGDIQKLDVGIALSHFDSVINEDGFGGSFIIDDPKLPTPENTQYIVSFKRR